MGWLTGRAFFGVVAAIGAGSVGVAVAQEVAVSESGQVGAPGTYQGVCPGTDHPPAVAPQPGARNVITWPGFQMLPDGGSRVFVQSTGPMSTGIHTAGDKIYIGLGSAKLAHTNNGRPLITRYFNTPVDEASIEIKGGQASLVLLVRAAVQPNVRTEQVAATGYHFVYVDFAPGQYVKGTSRAPSAPQTDRLPPSPGTAAASHVQGDPLGGGGVSGSASGSESATSSASGGKVKGKAEGKMSFGF